MRAVFLCATVGALLTFTPRAYAQDGSFLSGGQQLHYRAQGTGAPVVLLSMMPPVGPGRSLITIASS